MFRIAIIQFPGLNTEYETRREINRAGMRGEFFRWNDEYKKLEKYDGYVIGGGFSYEDRGRAGVIASVDPIMTAIKKEAAKGKPVLGVCNGCQILVESGLIPGAEGSKLGMAMARNKRVRGNDILGSYYNGWISMKHVAPKSHCMFTSNFEQGEIIRAPIAHGEGRFATLHSSLIEQLQKSGQIVFRYCDAQGIITEQFPVNPNGAMFNIGAICNPEGNVMGIMPHLERSEGVSQKLFTSLRDSLKERKHKGISHKIRPLAIPSIKLFPMPSYHPPEKTIQLFVSLIITDNEAETYDLTLKNMGFEKLNLKRTTHFELSFQGKPDIQKIMKKLIQSGVLLNTNKEWATVKFSKEMMVFDPKKEKFLPAAAPEESPGRTVRFLVREREDFIGLSKSATITHRLKFEEITGVKMGTVWTVSFATKSKNVAQEELKRLLGTYLFHNPHRQEVFLL